MRKQDDKLRNLLRKNWPCKIDSGHKEALRHKMQELDACTEAQDHLEYSGGDWVSTREERVKTRTIVRTDWRPVWAAAFILLAVVIILVPSKNISGTNKLEDSIFSFQRPSDHSGGATAFGENLITLFAPLGSKVLTNEEAVKVETTKTPIEKRYIYAIGDLTFESKIALTPDQVIQVFKKQYGEDLDVTKFSQLEVMAPENYYLETEDGSILQYGVTEIE